jgi:histidinol-phosphatase
LHEIADRADAIALGYFRSDSLRVDTKADASPVTEADRAIEDAARKLILVRCPELEVYGEEFGGTPGAADRRLIIDPIDATRNFVRGIPIFATLLGVEVAGEIVAGLVSAPGLGTRWHAERGHGAYHGSRRMAVSRIDKLAEAQLFHADIGGLAEQAPPTGFARLVAEVERARGFGDFYQHVLVGDGSGEIGLDPVVQPWDIAPLLVIVEEAGGRATTLTGERTIYGGSLVTSNGLLHDAALCRLRS